MVRAGADCREIYDASCAPFEAAGQPTQRTKEPGKPLTNGYYHGLGHGVGLEIHERPGLGRSPDRCWPATSSRSSRAATGRASAACASRTSWS